MITIKYQVFFFDPAQNRENQLQAIQPLFHAPSAIKILMKTAKYEGKQIFVFAGTEESLLQFVKNVERADLTEWLDHDVDGIAVELDKLAEKFKLSRFELNTGSDDGDELVLGDPPLDDEDGEEVTAARKKKNKYPSDIPERNRWLWDNMIKCYRPQINKRCKKDPDKKLAAQRLLYFHAARKLGLVPYSSTTTKQVDVGKTQIIQDIELGEAKASDMISVWQRHLKSDGTLKKAKAIKYLGSEYENTASRYYIAHAIEWKLGTDWRDLGDYLKKGHGFQVMSKDHLSMTINRLTKLEVINEGDCVYLYVSHVMTPAQAEVLTGENDKNKIVKKLHKYSLSWYKKGKFPSNM